jgi:hypothetical protein
VITLFRPLRAVAAPAARQRAGASPSSHCDDQDQDDIRACGWFDSSHELRQGLWVQEHSAADSLPAELPLADWLTLNLWSNPVTV